MDWVDIGSTFGSTLRNGDVTVVFTEIMEENPATNCLAAIGFKRDDVFLKLGEFMELRMRIYRTDWSKYVQSNDFSFQPESTDYTEWNKLAVWIGNRWAYGSIPLSYADWMEPNPEEDKEVTYPSDAEGVVTSYTYNAKGAVTKVTKADGSTQHMTYDKKGNQTSVTDGTVTKETDAMGAVTTYQYDKTTGRLLHTINAVSGKESYGYDEMGNVVQVTAPKGLVFRGRRNPHKTKENLRVCRRWHYDRTNSKDYRIVRAFEP